MAMTRKLAKQSNFLTQVNYADKYRYNTYKNKLIFSLVTYNLGKSDEK